jgi:hypothetical protein
VHVATTARRGGKAVLGGCLGGGGIFGGFGVEADILKISVYFVYFFP